MAFIKNWFSNFLPFEKPLMYQGFRYMTPEHFFQAMKTVKTDTDGRAIIASALTPGIAKRLGRKVNLRPDWEGVKEDVMEYALRYKFQEGTKWHEELIITSGDIVEWNNWHDNIWGSCICEKCGSKGKNLLGKLLMKIRHEFLCD